MGLWARRKTFENDVYYDAPRRVRKAGFMLTVRNAILHAFDFDTGLFSLSDHELDMDEKLVKSYVRRHLRRCAASERNMHGEFSEDSGFADELRHYLAHQTSFVELSKLVAQFLWETLRTCDDLVQADLLVADFEESIDPSKDPTDEELEKSYNGETRRRFAIVLLPRRQSFMHSIEHPAGGAFNEIVRHDATLPNPSGKVNTYALIDCETFAIDFSDCARTIAEAEVWVFPNMLLRCTREPSSHEVVQQVEHIVEEVGELSKDGVVSAVSRAKACVAHSAELDERLMPAEIGKQVFSEEPHLAERYEEAAREAKLPDEVHLAAAAARRLAQKHRIRTDTGIDISFPTEYSRSPEYFSISHADDGTLTITISNVQHIENR